MIHTAANTGRQVVLTAILMLLLLPWRNHPLRVVKAFVVVPSHPDMARGAAGKYVDTDNVASTIPESTRHVRRNRGYALSSSSCLSMTAMQGTSDTTTSATIVEESTSEDGTLHTLTMAVNNNTKIQFTLIGTAHLSEKSNQQVRQVIETTRPDIVLVELDQKRLPRIGFAGGVADLQLPTVTAVPQEILDACLLLPTTPEDMAYQQGNHQQPWWQAAQNLVEQALVQAFTVVARKLLTSMYDDMGNNMGGQKGGGEFLAAIQAAQNVSATTTTSSSGRRPIEIILGDRDSVETIRRAATLAMRSGKPWQVLERFNAVSSEEMSRIYDTVVKEQNLEKEDEVVINTAIMEALKSNPALRQGIFDRLQSEVPEFARAVLWERDYIMAECMRQQALHRLRENNDHNNDDGPLQVVAVVGAAHVPGMVQHLKNTTSATAQ